MSNPRTVTLLLVVAASFSLTDGLLPRGRRFNGMSGMRGFRAHLPYPSEFGEDPGKYRPLPIGMFAPPNTTNPLAPFMNSPQLLQLLLTLDRNDLSVLANMGSNPSLGQRAMAGGLLQRLAQG